MSEIKTEGGGEVRAQGVKRGVFDWGEVPAAVLVRARNCAMECGFNLAPDDAWELAALLMKCADEAEDGTR